ncbi:MAG: response regulator transcription factor [Treponema sp.]|nr:response regulator transcription factor [Treponema sp.]
MAGQELNILLADDQFIFAETLGTVLNNYADDIKVLGIAENGEKAVTMTREFKPNIILMDVRMPIMDGVEAVRIIKKEFPEIKIIMLSTYREDVHVRSSLMAGASGYLLKDVSPTELITAIRALNSGIMQISPDIVKQLIQNQYNPAEKLAGMDLNNSEKNQPLEWIHSLTKRERELFILIATGYDNEEIAEKMNLSLQTIMNMVSTVYSKLGVKDRFEIIRLANSKKP